jgi:F-type H+-transporting ATPase subunit alpha
VNLKPEEITEILKQQIAHFDEDLSLEEVGIVLSVGDGIARVYGLQGAMAGEMLSFENGIAGMVLNLEEDNVGAVLMGEETAVKEGQSVRRTGHVVDVPVGEAMVGRVVNALGEPIDGLGPIDTTLRWPVERPAPGIIARQPVNVPLQTGLKAVDSMIPIGRGQRELIIGDRSTGKTALAVDTILNQKGQGVICVYVAIGQKQSTVARVVRTLADHDALGYTIVVSSSASEPA